MINRLDTGNVQIDLEEDSNIFPIEKIDRGGEVELTLHFSTEPAIPSGKYPIIKSGNKHLINLEQVLSLFEPVCVTAVE